MRMLFHTPCGDCLDRMNFLGKQSGVELINPSVINV
jgi:hypothetical protein